MMNTRVKATYESPGVQTKAAYVDRNQVVLVAALRGI